HRDLHPFPTRRSSDLERILESYLGVSPRGFSQFLKAGPLWIKEKLFLDRNLREELGGYTGSLLYAEHHESHAASAFFPSPFHERSEEHTSELQSQSNL